MGGRSQSGVGESSPRLFGGRGIFFACALSSAGRIGRVSVMARQGKTVICRNANAL